MLFIFIVPSCTLYDPSSVLPLFLSWVRCSHLFRLPGCALFFFVLLLWCCSRLLWSFRCAALAFLCFLTVSWSFCGVLFFLGVFLCGSSCVVYISTFMVCFCVCCVRLLALCGPFCVLFFLCVLFSPSCSLARAVLACVLLPWCASLSLWSFLRIGPSLMILDEMINHRTPVRETAPKTEERPK